MFAFFMFVIIEFVFFVVFILVGFLVIAGGLRSLLVEFLVTVLASFFFFAMFMMFTMRIGFIVV